jgi:hypothetical protein
MLGVDTVLRLMMMINDSSIDKLLVAVASRLKRSFGDPHPPPLWAIVVLNGQRATIPRRPGTFEILSRSKRARMTGYSRK